jgi:hypothetical protein
MVNKNIILLKKPIKFYLILNKKKYMTSSIINIFLVELSIISLEINQDMESNRGGGRSMVITNSITIINTNIIHIMEWIDKIWENLENIAIINAINNINKMRNKDNHLPLNRTSNK